MPTTDRGRRSRAVIVAAAARLMHDHGLAAPTVDEVLAASGTGKSQFYHYFDGRQDLAVAVLHHQFDLIMAAQPALTDPSCDDLVRWRNEVLLAHRDSDLGSCPLGVFVGQADGDPLLRDTLNALFSQWEDALRRLVARARAADRTAPVDPAIAARGLLVALQGGTLLAHLRHDPGLLVQALDGALDGVLTGGGEALDRSASIGPSPARSPGRRNGPES